MTQIQAKETPPVSIIIPTLNEEKYLPALLQSLANIDSPLDIIVVDGSSIDGTARVVHEHQIHFSGDSSLRIILAPERGTSLQRNLGAEVARHSIFIFCDADMIAPSSGDFKKYISAFIDKGSVVASPILSPIESGIRIALLHKVLVITQRVFLLMAAPRFAGAGLTTTKDVFHKIGGFDTSLRLGEDIDYSLRASKHGPGHQIQVVWSVSARRFIKYGYGWLFKELHQIVGLMLEGRLSNPEKIFYPFGDYSK